MTKTIKNSLMMAFGLALGLFAKAAHAQTFTPPTVLPAENADIGGAGGACIGLADMIRTGNIHSWNIPCFIKYITQVAIGAGGTIAVIMVMVGGYYYMLGGEEGHSKGKKYITYALIGLAIALMAWIIVDIAVRFATE